MKKKLFVILWGFVVFLAAFLFINCNSNSFPVLGQNKVFHDNLYKEYMNLGNSYYDIEKYSEAISFYEKVLDDESLGNVAYYKMAQCYSLLSDWGNALPMYEKLLEDDPENQAFMANIAYIYTMTRNVKDALGMYDKLLDKQPNNVTYIENYLAILLSDKSLFIENEEKFEELFSSLKESYPKNKNIEIFQKKYDEFKEENSNSGK